jgi:membrane protease YdiL (CAAX protease family)
MAWFCIYIVYPALIKAGLPQFWILWLCIGAPLFLMLVASLIGYRLEGNPWSWSGIKSRFRLKPMSRTDWLWTLVLIAWIGVYMLLHSSLSKWLASIPFFAPPTYLPSLLDPRITSTSIPAEFLGIPLKGNWWILLVQTGILFFNIFGEEFWWRGYILPRQELTHGKHTWWIHGLLWTAFHSFWKWDLFSLMPGLLLLSYVVYRQKNTTPAIIWHWLNNGLTLIAVLLGILGFGT